MVGARGFEPPTPDTPCQCATRLRYAPIRTCILMEWWNTGLQANQDLFLFLPFQTHRSSIQIFQLHLSILKFLPEVQPSLDHDGCSLRRHKHHHNATMSPHNIIGNIYPNDRIPSQFTGLIFDGTDRQVSSLIYLLRPSNSDLSVKLPQIRPV